MAPTAIVEPGAVIGLGTHIGHHAHIRPDVRIGQGCTLGKNVFVDSGVSVGDRSVVGDNVSLYSGVQLEAQVLVGPSAVFTNDRLPRAVSPDWQQVATTVREGAAIGANATIVCGVELGRWSVVEPGAVVTRSVADHELVGGVPARRLGWVCACGSVIAVTVAEIDTMQCGACAERFTDR